MVEPANNKPEEKADEAKPEVKAEAKSSEEKAEPPKDVEAPAAAEEEAPAEQKPAPAGEKVRDLVKYVEERSLRKDLPHFQVGDTVRLSLKVKEKDKTRIQNFDGVVIRRSGRGVSEVFTVRRISFGVGVEKTIPTNSPIIAGIKVLRAGVVRRARLYYLRGRSGKEGRIKEDEKRILQARGTKADKKKKKPVKDATASSKLAKKRAAKGKKKEKRAARKKTVKAKK